VIIGSQVAVICDPIPICAGIGAICASSTILIHCASLGHDFA